MSDRINRMMQIILDSVNDGVFTVDENWRITFINKAAQEIIGISREEALGNLCYEVFRANICEADCALRWTMDSNIPIVNKAIYIINADGDRIPVSISTAILHDREGEVVGGVETFRDLSQVEEWKTARFEKYRFCNLVSKSENMHQIFDVLPTIAESESTVLIEGESGTGKELLARTIHDLSPRKGGPLVCVNCAALPDTLLESELFGYKKGSFTGASGDKPGRFSLADGGTLFLDEIGDISLAMQVKLLRALQERTFEPLGATKSVSVNIRVVVATNKRLEELIHRGLFREDLFYRINVVKITMPPLRDRKEDIPLLADLFISRFNLVKNKDIVGLSPEAMELLNKHNYPGNIRELENAIEHAFAFCTGGIIEPSHLPLTLGGTSAPDAMQGQSLKDFEAQSILSALRKNNWNRGQTARQLGIHPSTLWRKITKFGIRVPISDGRSRQ